MSQVRGVNSNIRGIRRLFEASTSSRVGNVVKIGHNSVHNQDIIASSYGSSEPEINGEVRATFRFISRGSLFLPYFYQFEVRAREKGRYHLSIFGAHDSLPMILKNIY